MLRKRIYILTVLVILMLIALTMVAIHQVKHIQRDLSVLMNTYYQLKTKHPDAAHQALLIILNQDKNYRPALEEGSQWYLQRKDYDKALPLLKRLHQQLPNAHRYTFQLAFLYYEQGEWLQARKLFLFLAKHASGELQESASQALNAMASYLPSYQFFAHDEAMPTIEQSTLLPRSRMQPKPVVQRSIQLQSFQWQEQGFRALKRHRPSEAEVYFKRAYATTNDPVLAMQLAYLYDAQGDKPTAYQYFRLATKSHHPKMAFQAQNAMTNLGGLQTKALPTPYFSEVFFNPFSQTRFGLTVRPLVIRLGVEEPTSWQTKQYVFFRRTDDNKSKNLGLISQIYEDNVQITGMGAQLTPIAGLPIVGFLEAGTAYDLVYRNRDRWRGDLRGGFMYYNEFGARPAYFANPTWSNCYYSDLYADITYFSRYDNNVIAGIKTHQGIRLLQYHSTMLSAYATVRAITDTKRLFFNNFVEVGPGIEWIPTNRFYNVRVRVEHVNGMYTPAGAIPNPYAKYYTNSLIQLIYYIKA